MAIPDFQTIMRPLLEFHSDGKEHTTKGLNNHLANYFELTDEDLKILIPSKTQTLFYNRIGWAKTHLKAADLLESPTRGITIITKSGIDVLNKYDRIDLRILKILPAFKEKQKTWGKKKEQDNKEDDDRETITQTPIERIESGIKEIRESLIEEISKQLKYISPFGFERLVLLVLNKMGYGLTDTNLEPTAKTGDEGIDGVIKQDKLGLEKIYIQAKKWENPIGRPEIQKFFGALAGQRAKNGVFITTSSFAKNAYEYVRNLDRNIVLINGRELAEFMIDHNVGVSTHNIYEISKIDNEWFEEFK